jgi:HTH-type transcriptional regulator/antitoxin MqsA
MSFTHSHKQLQAKNQFHECDFCGTEVVLKEDARFNAKTVLDAKQIADGRLTASDIRSIRKHLGLKQEIAGRIIGGGPTAFSKYEHSELAPTDAMDNLLWLLSEHEFLIYELGRRHGVDIESTRSVSMEATTIHGYGSVHSIVSRYSKEVLKSLRGSAQPFWVQNIHPTMCKGLTEPHMEAANEVVVSYEANSYAAGCVA